MSYKIAYIDENDGWLNTVYQTFKNDFEVTPIKVLPESTVESIFEEICRNEFDAIITDYLLEEEGDVSFNGNKIVERIREYKPHFPVIMLTAHEPEAISQMDNVHIIYDKNILDGESEEALNVLKSKIKSNISHYYQKIETTKKSIEDLVAKKNSQGLNISEEDSLVKLFITMDELEPEGRDMPANLIQRESITKLTDFVARTREILEELKNTNQK